MTFPTQSSSKFRLKNDTLGDGALTSLYEGFRTLDIESFEHLCIEVVQAGGGNQPTKDKLISAIKSATKKETKLKKAQDFILAGMGLGV